ncbi:MAG: 4Fe-4S binding protein [Eggerthellaceae bacterium]|nr:4Fe-4S binding protein [Eggerthellaceae bacterium]
MAKIYVDETFCKGCGLCVDACPLHLMQLDKEKMTVKGYHPAVCTDQNRCTACCSCAMMCPDVAIKVVK